MSDDETSLGEGESADRPTGEGSSWKPYRPPSSKRGSILHFFRRYAFSITLVATILAVGALIYYAPERLAPDPSAGESPPVDRFSSLYVYSQPDSARVIVENDTLGTTPLESRRLSPGTYFVSVTKEGYVAQDTVLTLAANEPTIYTPRLNQRGDLIGGEEPSPDRSPDDASNQPSPQESYAESPPATRPDRGDSQEQATRSATERTPGSLTTGRLTLQSTPGSVTVELNGYRVGSTPVSLDQVAAGTHEITFAHPEYETVTKQVEVSGNDTVAVDAILEAKTGYLRVLARPWGSIYIDDERRAQDSDVWYETELRAGTHTVTVRHPALGEMQRDVDVTPRDTQSVVLDLRGN